MILLEVKNLSRNFGGVRALDAVNITQAAGETLGMIGPNGSGKTSFVNAVTGHLVPDKGTICFGGDQITGLRPHQITRAGLTRTYQQVRVLGKLTVSENLATARLLHADRGLSDDDIAALLDWLKLDHCLDHRAGGLTLFEQRRLELAMRLLLKPRLIMLDEPVGGLAAGEVREMIELLTELRARCAVFVIEHTMKVIRELADRVVVLIAGEKIADGPPAEILRDRRVIEHYLGAVHA